MNSDIYDYIIIGGGISGVYALHLFNEYMKNSSKSLKILLIEKDKKLGGRSEEIMFHGNLIKLGAGIGADDNVNLLELLDKFKIKYSKSMGDKNVINGDEEYSHNKTLTKIKTEKYCEDEIVNKYINLNIDHSNKLSLLY